MKNLTTHNPNILAKASQVLDKVVPEHLDKGAICEVDLVLRQYVDFYFAVPKSNVICNNSRFIFLPYQML